MTLAALAIAAEYADAGVASNCLWPQTTIATAAVGNLLGGKQSLDHSRSPEIMADAAIEILRRPAATATGRTFLDVECSRTPGSPTRAGTAGGPSRWASTSSSTASETARSADPA